MTNQRLIYLIEFHKMKKIKRSFTAIYCLIVAILQDLQIFMGLKSQMKKLGYNYIQLLCNILKPYFQKFQHIQL